VTRTISGMSHSLADLNRDYSLGDALLFVRGGGGMARAEVQTDACRAELYLHGAHVTRWRPAGHDEVLWTSERAMYAYDKPIRGGVPISFPWFAGHQPVNDPNGPNHGYARLQPWHITQTRQTDAGVSLTLTTTVEPFVLEYEVVFGKELSMTLQVANHSKAQASYEAALHSYFTISQIHNVTVSGLEGASYLNTVGGANTPEIQDDRAITFHDETDRIYESQATCVIHDPGLSRRVVIDKRGSESTVVWNPWFAKAKAMRDFGDDEWPGMVCVETACIDPNRMVLKPGGAHTTSAHIHIEDA